MKALFFRFVIFVFLCSVSTNAYGYSDKFETRINLWPFFVYTKSKSSTQLRVLGPFVLYKKTPKFKKLSLRPIYTSITYPNKKQAFFLSPLGKYEVSPFRRFFGIVPIIFFHERFDPFGGKSESYNNILLIFWGHTSSGSSYGGLFPIYGVFKEKFATKQITFFLWPIYTKVEYPNYNATSILWPLIRLIHSSNPNYSGFKFFPFYEKIQLGSVRKEFFLWPFYIREYTKGKEENAFDKIIIFPFYAKERSRFCEKQIFLWPFFKFIKKKEPYSEEIDAPWPIFVRIKGEEINSIRFWPIYTYTRTPYSKDYCILWPFICYNRDYIKEKHSFFIKKDFRFLILSKFTKIYANNYVKKQIKLWPFIYWEERSNFNGTSEKHWYFPYIIPIRNRGVEENYLPFLKLIEFQKKGDKSNLSILWGFITKETIGKRSVFEVAFLFRRVKDPEHNTNYFEILDGLLGFGKIDNHKVCKVLFINFCK